MNRIAKMMVAVSALGLWAGVASASDWNPLGFYAGVGVGESTVRSDEGFDPYYPDDSHPHHTAFKGIVGIRPIPFVGAEVEYIDFGHDTSADGYYDRPGYENSEDSHPKAGVLYAVGYLPLPFVDLFVKGGMARLETNLNSYSGGACTGVDSDVTCTLPVLSRQHAWETKAAYGAGVQAHFLGLGVRAEYERISSSFGDPDAFMVSATWTF